MKRSERRRELNWFKNPKWSDWTLQSETQKSCEEMKVKLTSQTVSKDTIFMESGLKCQDRKWVLERLGGGLRSDHRTAWTSWHSGEDRVLRSRRRNGCASHLLRSPSASASSRVKYRRRVWTDESWGHEDGPQVSWETRTASYTSHTTQVITDVF